MIPTETQVMPCNYSNREHLQAIPALLNAFIEDKMGGGTPLSEPDQLRLTDGLNNHPRAIVLLAQTDGVFTGLLVAFENFSTFTAKPMVNIHDVFVLKEYRGQGVGRKLMDAVIAEAGDRKCSFVTLEVRTDNPAAQSLYKSLGFDGTKPDLLYWRKDL